MLKENIFLLIVLFPACMVAQTFWGNDSTSRNIRENDCLGKVFTLVENPPSLKISNKDFEDTLTSYLKSKNAFFSNKKVIFKFIVTTQSQLFDLTTDSGEISKEAIVKEALVNYSHLWVPAKQNKRIVCSYVRLEIVVEDDKLHIAILRNDSKSTALARVSGPSILIQLTESSK